MKDSLLIGEEMRKEYDELKKQLERGGKIMIGLIVKYMDKIYKVGTPGEGVTLSSCIVRKEFILEAGGMQHGFVGIFRKSEGRDRI